MIASGEAVGDQAATNALIVVEQADRIAATIRRMLDFARSRESPSASADPTDVVHRTVDLLEIFARDRGVRLAVDAGGGSLRCRASAHQLQQVLTNLVVNGIQAMDKGTLTLRVLAADRDSVGPDARGSGPWVRIEVQDEGMGIEADNVDRIFEAFYTTKPPGVGTGLGLTVVRDIVVAQGGWIEVHSEPGHGTCICVHLPREEP
jgi:signal transduction histidine kinase